VYLCRGTFGVAADRQTGGVGGILTAAPTLLLRYTTVVWRSADTLSRQAGHLQVLDWLPSLATDNVRAVGAIAFCRPMVSYRRVSA